MYLKRTSSSPEVFVPEENYFQAGSSVYLNRTSSSLEVGWMAIQLSKSD